MPARESQEETTFLRHVIAYDDTTEGHKLDQRITQAQRDAYCVRRAIMVMALLAALAIAGLGYAAVLFPHHPLDLSRFFLRPIVKWLLALGLAASGCALAFRFLEAVYRKRLDEQREECRRFAAKVIESRLGHPPARPPRSRRVDGEERELSRGTMKESRQRSEDPSLRSSTQLSVTYE